MPVLIPKNRRLRGFRPFLVRWAAFVRRYCYESRSFGDTPYWYGERASLSLLAAAIWSCGGVALEEYGAEKKWVERGRRRPYAGRVDLYFRWRRQDYVVEAKTAWFAMSRRTTPAEVAEHIREALRGAKKAVLMAPDEGQRLSLVFVVPSMPKVRRGESFPRRMLRTFMDGLEMVDACFVAWTSPAKPASYWLGKRMYPVVALVGRVPVRRR